MTKKYPWQFPVGKKESATNQRKRVEAFLKEYDKLCEKYGVSIGACGCCDSPWVADGTVGGGRRTAISERSDGFPFSLTYPKDGK